MTPLELMIVGYLTTGPKEGTALMELLDDEPLSKVSDALARLRRQEVVVSLPSGRFALVYGGGPPPKVEDDEDV
jgi:hypothetical protein